MLGVGGGLKQLGSENQSLQTHHAQMQSSLGVENDSPSHFAGIYSDCILYTTDFEYKSRRTFHGGPTAPTWNEDLNFSKWGPNGDLILSEMGTKWGPSAKEMGTKSPNGD